MFKRVSLSGSAELFRETASAPEYLAETDPEPAAIHQLPLRPEIERVAPPPREPVRYLEYQFTESQVHALIDSVQKLKYPHTVRTSAKLSMEEFEALEALRQILLDGLR